MQTQIKTVSIHDATASLFELVQLALQGDEVIIAEAGTPLVRLVPVVSLDQPRMLGLNEGQIWMSDDFDEPLSDEFWLDAE